MIWAAGVLWSISLSGRVIGRMPHMIKQAGMRQMMHHRGAEAAGGALLDGDQHGVIAGQLLDQGGVERLCEARVNDGWRQAVGCELIGGAQHLTQACVPRLSRAMPPFCRPLWRPASRNTRPRPIWMISPLRRQRPARRPLPRG